MGLSSETLSIGEEMKRMEWDQNPLIKAAHRSMMHTPHQREHRQSEDSELSTAEGSGGAGQGNTTVNST